MAIRGSKGGAAGRALAANVAAIRRERKLDQAALSARTGDLGRPLSVSTLSRIELGERRVDVDDLVVLALALDCSPGRLLLPQLQPFSPGLTARQELTASVSADTESMWAWATGERPLQAGDPAAEASFARENRPHRFEMRITSIRGEDLAHYQEIAAAIHAAVKAGTPTRLAWAAAQQGLTGALDELAAGDGQ